MRESVAQKIGRITKEVIEKNEGNCFCYGHLDESHEIHDRMGWTSKHPITVHNRVLSALQKHCALPDSLFVEHRGYFGLRGQSNCRGFWLKESK